MNKQHIAGSRVSAAAFRRRSALMLSAGAASLLLACPALAQTPPAADALPQGHVSHGGVSSVTYDITPTVTVEQNQQRALIDWTSFDIGSNATVTFNQPSNTAIALNRVTGGDPTQIYGTLNANGIVGILNANGVYFDGSASVNVGGLIATTGDLENQAEYLAGGPIRFTGATAGKVSIGSGATITVASAGLAAFVAPNVVNNGTINASAGLVELAAGNTFTLDLGGDGLLALGVSSDDPLVENYGDIFASGGTIRLSAQAASTVVDDVIKANGVLQVDAAHDDNGEIVLTANGGVALNGFVDGGSIAVTGRRIHGAPTIETAGSLTLNVNPEGEDTTGQTLIADALDVIGVVGGGTTLNLGAGTYAAGATINTANVTVDGGGVATIAAQLNGEDGIIVGGNGDGATITGLNILGAADQSYVTYAWGGDITRGVRILNGAENVTVANNVITGVRNGVLIDGRNTGSQIVNNVIDNTKSGISVQYTDGSNLVIAGNQDGAFGNEWGVNVHLNGIWNGAPITPSAGALGPNTPLAEQQRLLALSQANNGMSVYNQAWSASNRTHVNVATTGSSSAQGAIPTPIDTIQGGINAVVTGGFVDVADGTYNLTSSLTINKTLTLQSINPLGAVIDAKGMPATPLGRIVNVLADDVVIDGFAINGSGTHVGVSIPGQGVTVSNNAINNVLTGVQTNTGNAVGNATISGNTITGSTVGISLQNTGNIVSGNTVTASTEGVGLLYSDNTFTNNTFNIGAGGDALNFYGAATSAGLITAGNIVSIQGGGLQNAVYLAGAVGTVNAGDGTYNENILINAPDMTLRSINKHGAVIDAGGTGSGISISSVNGNLGEITIDGFTVQNWNVGGISQGMAAAPFATVHVLNNNVIGPVGGSTNHGNGIQVSGNGSTVIGNTVTGAVLNSANWSGSGILVVNGSNILVQGNQVSDSDVGIAVMNWNVGDVSGVTIDGNTLSGHSEAISIQAYGGAISDVTITGNDITGNESGLGVWDWGGAYSGGTLGNWADTVTDVSGNTFADNQTHASSDFADADVLSLFDANTFDRTIHATGGDTIYGDLSYAVSDAAAGSDLLMSNGVFVEDDRIVIDRDLTLTGGAATVIQAGANFTGSGKGQSWWLVEDGVMFDLYDVALDGAGQNIDYAFRNHGDTYIEGVDFRNIRNGKYGGVAVASFGGNVGGGAGAGSWADSYLDIRHSSFENIGRIGVLVKGDGAEALVLANSFTGKGAGDHLDYGVEVGAGAFAEIDANTITNNLGVASSDGSTSAGVLVTTYYGAGSEAFLTHNSISGNTSAVAVGYDGSDTSVVDAFNNDLSGNVNGVTLTSNNAAAKFDFNWWGTFDDDAIAAYMGGAHAGAVDFSTYLVTGTNTGPIFGLPAFWGVTSEVAVTNLGGQTGGLGRIQEAVDGACYCGTVYINNGVYAETVTIAGDGAPGGESFALIGESQANTIINGGIRITDHDPAGSWFENIWIEDLTINASAGQTGLIALSNNDGVYNTRNLTVSDVTVNGNNQHAVGLFDVDGATFTDVTINGVSGSNGIEAVGLVNFSMTGGSISGAGIGVNVFDVAGYEANGNLSFSNVGFSNNGTQIALTGAYADLDAILANNTFDRSVVVRDGGNISVNSIFSAIQDGVNAASAGDTVEVGAGTYAEDVASNNANMTLAFNTVTVDSLALTGAGTQVSGNLTGAGDLSFAGLTLSGALNLTSQTGNVTTGAVNGAHALSATANAGTVGFGALNVGSVTASGANIVTAGVTTNGAQSYTGPTTLNGAYTTGGGAFTVAGATTLAGATDVATGGGNATFDAVNGAAPGAQAFTANAGAGSISLGSIGATARLGAVQVVSANTVLSGDTYAGNSLNFGGGAVQLTAAQTTFDSRISPAASGNITFASNITGTANGAQSVAFIAGSGASLAGDGDITLANAGTDAVRLGAMSATGGDFSAQTVKLAGDFTSTLSGDQVFSANTLDTQGNVNSQVGGNVSGPIIAGQGVILTAGGDITSSSVSAGGPVVLAAGGQIVSTITTPGSITLTAQQGLDVQLTGGAVFISAPNGVVKGVFSTISSDGNGAFVINGQRQAGDPTDPRQILIDSFVTPAGGVVGPTGVIELPAGLALGLIAPAGEGEGQRPAVLVNDVARLGELLRLGYTAIIVQIDESGLIIEEELILAEAAQ